MSEVNKELVSLGKVEEAKVLTQEEIDNKIINQVENIKNQTYKYWNNN